ncbi:ABC transporter ATP-binding protein [Listeria costaricensis]|uniref:ABC transporter ATP-binding protein n=1 Tax=Listeria costaricensis TaxID=2026604 RepID=UPI000C0863EE|nr:ABC transporter ATP-binding protein [Listeria costaricensis]
MLKIEHIEKSFQKEPVLKDVSFEIASNSCTALIGPNGAGKTTLLHLIVQILKADAGEILIEGTPVYKRRGEIGFLPQTPQFYPWMTAQESLLFAGRLSGMSEAQCKKRAKEVLQIVGLDEKAAKKRVSQFSGGMKQRLGIAQAIIHEPKLLVMDEPVSALDPIGRREVIALIEKLKQQTTILFSTHILADAAEVSEHVLMIRQGEIILQRSLEELTRESATNRLYVVIDGKPLALDLVQKLTELSGVKIVEQKGRRYELQVEDPAEISPRILQKLLDWNIGIEQFEHVHEDLEQIFLRRLQE